MSAISTILTRLRAAIWAIDVRDDIANAIEQCYSDVSNPTLKTEALEAALQTKIDEGEMAALTIGDGTITAAKLASGIIDNTLATSGAAADAKKTGDELSALKADLSELEIDLGGEIETQEEIDFIYNYYINIRDNTVIPINEPVADNRYKYAVVDCSEGDIFLINAFGGGAPRAYCFIDSSNTKLLASGADENILNTKITAPANSAKIIIQDRYYDPDGYDFGDLPSYKIITTKGVIGDIFVRFDKTQNKTDSEKAIARENIGLDELPDGLSDDVKQTLLACFAHVVWVDEHGPDYYEALEEALYADTIKYGVYMPKTVIDGQYIDEHGEIQNGQLGKTYYIEDYIPVKRKSYWIGNQPPKAVPLKSGSEYIGVTSESNWRVSEYDKNKIFIKQTHFGPSEQNEPYSSSTIVFDNATKYIRIGWYDVDGVTHEFDIENPIEVETLPMELGSINSNTGQNENNNARIRTTGYIEIENEKITVAGCPFASAWSEFTFIPNNYGFYVIRCYDSNKSYIGSTEALLADVTNQSLPVGTKYVRIIMQNSPVNFTNYQYLVSYLMTINGIRYHATENA